MEVVTVLRLPLSIDLSGFVCLLQQERIPFRVTESGGEQVLLAPLHVKSRILDIYHQYPQGMANDGADSANPWPTHRNTGYDVLHHLRNFPVTLGFLAVTLVFALLTLLGDNFTAIRWISFLDYHIQGDTLYFVPWLESLKQGQVWRLITPIFIHFGILHLVVNALWFWELGRRIEIRQGHLGLLLLTLLYALLTNLMQFFFSDAALFGGLSGVIYAFFGHCWVFCLLAPTRMYYLPKELIVLMLGWLVFCFTGAPQRVGLNIANAAHLGGLIIGCATGLVGGLYCRLRQQGVEPQQ